MGSKDELVQQQIAALRVVYVQQLPQRLDETRDAFERWVKSKAAGELFTFYRLTHNLAGSGALYGFEEITEKALAIEHVVTVLIEKKAPPTPTDIATLRVRLAALGETLCQIARG